MTIACVWWDESSGLSRITAIADSRAAFEKKKHEWVSLAELTMKLFAIRLRCHELRHSPWWTAGHGPLSWRAKRVTWRFF